jgi:NADH-quinone oxidoreductase subunit F
VQAIPAYRLPREELDREVKMIADMGATFVYGKALGRDFTLQSLKDEGYEAVFLGVGAPQGMGIGVPGEDGPGVYDGLSFLKQYNLEGKAPVGKHVAVIGGGNAAIDAARTALRLGAEAVKILYRRTLAQMPAWGEEIDAADLEGIELMTLVAPQEILRDAAGNVTGVRCQ